MNLPIAWRADVTAEIAEAIDRLLADAEQRHLIIRCGADAARLAAEYPKSGVTIAKISGALLRAAMEAGVPVQMTRSPRSDRNRPETP